MLYVFWTGCGQVVCPTPGAGIYLMITEGRPLPNYGLEGNHHNSYSSIHF